LFKILISLFPQAKDLIRHLLVRDAHARFSAEQVLSHSWFTQTLQSPATPPEAPRRQNAVKELTEFVETAVAVNRLLLQHLAFSRGPAFRVRGRSPARGEGDEDDEYLNFEVRPCGRC
jgi:serine/threonine protein kinase